MHRTLSRALGSRQVVFVILGRSTLSVGVAAGVLGCAGISEQRSVAQLPSASSQNRQVRRDVAPPNYIYVTNAGTGGNQDQLLVYPAGVPNPTPTMSQNLGTSTSPFSVVTDHEGAVYVSLFGNGENPLSIVDIFSSGGGQLSGQLTSANGIGQPKGLAVDTLDNLYVANITSQSVKVYAHGTTAPFAAVTMPPGGYAILGGVTTDASNNLYVGTRGPDPKPPHEPIWGVVGCTPVTSPPWTCSPLANIVLAELSGMTVESNGNLAISSGHNLNHYHFTPPTWNLISATDYSCQVNLTTGADGALYVPLNHVGSCSSSVRVIPSGINAPYSITNGISVPLGAAAGP